MSDSSRDLGDPAPGEAEPSEPPEPSPVDDAGPTTVLVRRRRRSTRTGVRRWVRDLRRRPRVLAGLGVLALLLLAVGWGALTLARVSGDLDDARRSAQILRSELVRGDAAAASLAAFQDAGAAADDRTDGLTWTIAEHLPLLGDDARGLSTISDVLVDLGDDGLPPLVDAADDVTAQAFAPRDHVFPLAAISDLGPPAERSRSSFETAEETLGAVDTSGFAGPVRTPFEQLRGLVDDAATGLDAAYRASRLMPLMLGADGPRTYALIVQNNAELRSTGGLPGNVSVVEAEDGRVEITEQFPGGAFAETDEPVLPLRPDEATLYGQQLGTYFVDANFSPDLPRAAALWRAHWEQRRDEPLDGVVVVDPVVMSYLLAATGPIQAQGVTVDAGNVIQLMENEAYLTIPTNEAQDAFFSAVAKATFDVFADGAGDPVDLVRGLARGVEEGRVMVHSFQPDEQDDVAGTTIAGELQGPEDASEDPQMGVYLNDGTGAKLSYYLDYDVQVTAVSCEDGAQTYTGVLRATSNVPTDTTLLPESVLGPESTRGDLLPGQQVVVADVFAPLGGTFRDVRIDGKDVERPLLDRYYGRRVLSIGFYLAPQQSQRVEFTVTSGPGQPGETTVRVTPGVLPEDEGSVVPSTC